MFQRRVYMDAAAATPLHPAVFREMAKGFRVYGNPSAPHEEARAAKALVESARERIAHNLSVQPAELIFTSGGTEANNLAVQGVLNGLISRGAQPEDIHVVTSAFEHPSVHEPLASWARRGVSVSFVAPNAEGIITPESVVSLIRPETALVSIVAVQSEIGQIQPLKDIARILQSYRERRTQHVQTYAPEASFPMFHTDASQSPLFVDLSPERLGVDMATYDAQKMMGPRSTGLLFKRSWVPLAPFASGGKQERGLRPGTENVAGIVGMAKAFELARHGRETRVEKVTAVRDYFVAELKKKLPHVLINGSMKHRIANNVNISVPGADGDYLAVLMDTHGIAVSPRSACIASGVGSRTVEALGKGKEAAQGTLRFSFLPSVSKRDVARALSALEKCIAVAVPSRG